jgi:hypothetical protein
LTQNELLTDVTALDEETLEQVKEITETYLEILERVAEAQYEEERLREIYVVDRIKEEKATYDTELTALAVTLSTMTPEEGAEELAELALTPFEQEKLLRKHIIPVRIFQHYQQLREEALKPLEVEENARLALLHTESISCTDQRPFAQLESYIYKLNPQMWTQIIQSIINMCTKRQLFLETIQGQQALQKLMLQMYVPMYMQMPSTMNMLSMRVTQATMPLLKGLQGTLYALVSTQGQAVKTELIAPCKMRDLDTKQVSSGKTVEEEFPTKETIGTTDYIEVKLPVSLGWARVLQGRVSPKEEMMLIALMYCTNLPYYIKVWIARKMGYPENFHLYRKPVIHFLPLRITYGWRTRRYKTRLDITNFNRDEYLRLWKIYGSRY